jgi:hypothetical protein
MANIQEFAAAGFDSLQWSYRNTNGWHAGEANLTAANTGISSNMARFRGASSFAFAIPAPPTVAVQGDDGLLASFQFDTSDVLTFNMVTTGMDFDFLNAVQGTAIVTEGEWETTPGIITGAVRPQMILLASRRIKGLAGSSGDSGFEHLEIINAEISYLGSSRDFQAANQHNWQVTLNFADTLPDGRAVNAVHADAPNGELSFRMFTTAARFSYATLVGDNSVTQVTTSYKPITTARAKATLETSGFAANTVTAIDTTAPYGVTGTGTPASGKAFVVRYEFLNYE